MKEAYYGIQFMGTGRKVKYRDFKQVVTSHRIHNQKTGNGECMRSTVFSKLSAQRLAWSTAMMAPPTPMNSLTIISRHAEAKFPSDLDSVQLTIHTDHHDDLHAYVNPLKDQSYNDK